MVFGKKTPTNDALVEVVPTSPTIVGDEKHSDKVSRYIAEGDSEHEVGIDLYRRAGEVPYTPKEEKRMYVFPHVIHFDADLLHIGPRLTWVRLRKIDFWILPAFCVTQGLAYLDKTATNYGNLWGMKKDLHVTTAQFVSCTRAAKGKAHTAVHFPRRKLTNCRRGSLVLSTLATSFRHGL